MTASISNKIGGSNRSVFSLTLSDEYTECSALSWDEDIDSDDDSSGYLSHDDEYLDSQMMKGDFILEKPLDLHELDHMFDWGIGKKVKEAPPKFDEEIHDFAAKLPKRRSSFNEHLAFLSQSSSQGDAFESSALFSVLSDEFDSRELDSLNSSDDESDYKYEEDEDTDRAVRVPISKGKNDRASLIRQVSSMTSLADEDASIADSAYVMGTEEEEKKSRWTEGKPLERRISIGSRDSRWTEGLPREKRISDTSQGSHESRWTEDLPPEDSPGKPNGIRRESSSASMTPPRRRLSDVGDWNISRRTSITSSTVNFEMFNKQIQAEVGLQMSDSLPAQKIMEAIMSVLQNQEGESKQDDKRPQTTGIVGGTHQRESLFRAQ